MIKALTEEDVNATGQIVQWVPPSLIPPEASNRLKEHSKRTPEASLQAQKEARLKGTVAPSKLPRSSRRGLVEATEDVHRDKLGRGPDKPDGKGNEIPNKIGMSFQQKPRAIRKPPRNMRAIGPDMQQIEGRELETTPKGEIREAIEWDPNDNIK